MRISRLVPYSLLLATSLFATTVDSNIAGKMAVASYEDKFEFAKTFGTKKNSVSTALTHGVQYFVIEDQENIVVVVRGTDNIRNVLTDVMATEEPFLDDENVLVHQGFYSVAKEIFKTVKFKTKKPVILVGHSLGGAVALLYGTMLYEKGFDVTMYTFGMPPVVNKPFLKKYANIPHYRFYHIFDPIPTLSKPTLLPFKTQIKFKSFANLKDTISNMVDTIQTIPDKYRHHGSKHTIKMKIDELQKKVNDSLFFKTTTLYFDYHKISNYLKAVNRLYPSQIIAKNDDASKNAEVKKEIQTQNSQMIDVRNKEIKKQKKRLNKRITIIPSITKGTVPLNVGFYIDTADNEIFLYYFNFGGKEVLKKELMNDKISYTFEHPGKHNVKFAFKDQSGKIVESNMVISTREPTFQEYKDAFEKDFQQYLSR